MPARKQTIAAAEKKAIKQELAQLKKAERKIGRDSKTEIDRITKEITRLEKLSDRSLKNCLREVVKITRRQAILQARL